MKLNETDINKRLSGISGWTYKDNTLVKEFDTKNFVNAVAFLFKIAVEAEKMDHHPDVNIHSYNKVKISLSTHSENGITENDFKLAGIIDKLM